MAIEFDRVEFDPSNPEPRCACVLLLDTSSSMSGAKIDQLNNGLQAFAKALKEDELARLRVEVAIITFGGSPAVEQDFVVADQFDPPSLETGGLTPMGGAINLGLDKLRERRQVYKAHGVSAFRPWVFLITDGYPTDDEWPTAAQRVHQAESNKRIVFFAVGVEAADMDKLAQISKREPIKLKGFQFEKMFEWLSTSLTSVSHSRPGEDVPLQSPMGPDGWATT